MQTYKLLKDWHKNDVIRELTAKGIVSMAIIDYVTYYEFYTNSLKTNKASESIRLTSDEYNVSERTIRRAIKRMES